MCGICGIVHSSQEYTPDEGTLVAMRESLAHRGPDDSGAFIAPGAALGSRRLAILDLSAGGRMPMASPDGRFQIAYNGETYNYRELRSTSFPSATRFRSDTDTEVVLRMYAAEGPAMLNRLNGMFSIAIWDNKERSLFLGRDRLGIKPLYYAVRNGVLYFASEVKALAAAGLQLEFDQRTWAELLCFRYVAGEATPWLGVKRLLPGHYLLWRDGIIQIRRWWSLPERVLALRDNLPSDPSRWFADTFDSAIDLHRISDVPVGVLLSGGLDSSSVAASLAQQAGSGVASFTVRFPEQEYDEGPLAQLVADRYGLTHHELVVSPDKLLSLLHRVSWLNDEPLVHGNHAHLFAISQFAKSFVTVLLSGEGGDELLGGYVRYQPLRHPRLLAAARRTYPWVASKLGVSGRWRKLARFLELASLDRFVLFNACDVLPQDLMLRDMSEQDFSFREQVLSEATSLYPGDHVRQAMYSDQHTFLCSILDRNDRMTMGASIECRVPFLDYRLVETLAAMPSSMLMPDNQGKSLMRRAIGNRLPGPVLAHRKWGFGVPWRSYLRHEPALRELVSDLPDISPIREGPFERAALRNAVRGFLCGDNTHESLVRQLVMIAVWHKACVKGQSAPVHASAWAVPTEQLAGAAGRAK